MLIIRQLVEFSGKPLCPQDKPAMKTRTQRILHCTARSRAGRLLAATLSLAIWTNTAAANQAANVPAPSPNKLERITEFFDNEVAAGGVRRAPSCRSSSTASRSIRNVFGVQDVATRAPMTSDTIFAPAFDDEADHQPVAAMMLIDAGKPSLADPASRLIPGVCRREGQAPDPARRTASSVHKARSAGRSAGHHRGPAAPYVRHHLRLYRRQAHHEGRHPDSGLFDGRYDNKVFADRIARLPLALSNPGRSGVTAIRPTSSAASSRSYPDRRFINSKSSTSSSRSA